MASNEELDTRYFLSWTAEELYEAAMGLQLLLTTAQWRELCRELPIDTLSNKPQTASHLLETAAERFGVVVPRPMLGPFGECKEGNMAKASSYYFSNWNDRAVIDAADYVWRNLLTDTKKRTVKQVYSPGSRSWSGSLPDGARKLLRIVYDEYGIVAPYSLSNHTQAAAGKIAADLIKAGIDDIARSAEIELKWPEVYPPSLLMPAAFAAPKQPKEKLLLLL